MQRGKKKAATWPLIVTPALIFAVGCFADFVLSSSIQGRSSDQLFPAVSGLVVGVLTVLTHENRPPLADSDQAYKDEVAPDGSPFPSHGELAKSKARVSWMGLCFVRCATMPKADLESTGAARLAASSPEAPRRYSDLALTGSGQHLWRPNASGRNVEFASVTGIYSEIS